MRLFCKALQQEGSTVVSVHFRAESDGEAEKKAKRFKQIMNKQRKPPTYYAPRQKIREVRRIIEGERTVSLGE